MVHCHLSSDDEGIGTEEDSVGIDEALVCRVRVCGCRHRVRRRVVSTGSTDSGERQPLTGEITESVDPTVVSECEDIGDISRRVVPLSGGLIA